MFTSIIGILILVAGAFVAITQIYDIYILKKLFSLWPIIVSVIGFIRLKNRQGDKRINIAMIPIGIFLASLGIIYGLRSTAFFSWGVLMMLLGVAMVFSKNSSGKTNSDESIESEKAYKFEFDTDPDELDAKWSDITNETKWTFEDTKENPKDFEDPKKDKNESKDENWFAGDAPGGSREKKKTKIFVDNIIYTNVNSDKLKGFKIKQEDKLNDNYIFSTNKKIYKSDHFIGGKISSIFSDTWIDLSRVEPHMSDIRLDANIFFSSLKLRVPDDWIIYMSGNTIFGDTSIPNKPANNPKHRLFIKNNVTFGNINVEYKK
ncbi:MAG: LiaF-related protein [Tissierellia bacterium]|nr:LiaF-related protein [Tissierellia bacterium]